VKTPRDVSGRRLAAALAKLGYEVTRQTGRHLRLTREADPAHHVTIPDHDPVKVGTLNSILRDVAERQSMSKDDLLRLLFD